MVCLTHPSQRDGLGNQVLNRIEFMSLALKLNCGYRNPLFSSFDYNYGDGILDKESELKVLEILNNNSIPARASCLHLSHTVVKVQSLSPLLLKLLIALLDLLAFFLRKNFLIELEKSYHYIDSKERFAFQRAKLFRDLLDTKLLQSFRSNRPLFTPLRVIVVLSWAKVATLPERRVELEWFQNVLKGVETLLIKHNLEYVIRLHTDGVPHLDLHRKRWEISPETESYLRGTNILSHNKYKYQFIDFSKEFKFLDKGIFELVTNVSPLDIWNDFNKAPIIIGGGGSLVRCGLFHASQYSFCVLDKDCSFPGVHILERDFSNLDEILTRLHTWLLALSNPSPSKSMKNI